MDIYIELVKEIQERNSISDWIDFLYENEKENIINLLVKKYPKTKYELVEGIEIRLVEGIEDINLSNFKKLKEIDISGNEISILNFYWKNLNEKSKLSKLSCYCNLIKEINVYDNSFFNLETLDISKNQLTRFVSGCCIPNLRILDCSVNIIDILDLSGCIKLEELNCSYCNLDENSIKFSSYTNLRVANFCNNRLKKLNFLDSIDPLELIELNLSENLINCKKNYHLHNNDDNDSNLSFFSKFKNLRELIIQKNHYYTDSYNKFSGCLDSLPKKLTKLALDNSSVTGDLDNLPESIRFFSYDKTILIGKKIEEELGIFGVFSVISLTKENEEIEKLYELELKNKSELYQEINSSLSELNGLIYKKEKELEKIKNLRFKISRYGYEYGYLENFTDIDMIKLADLKNKIIVQRNSEEKKNTLAFRYEKKNKKFILIKK